MALPRPQVAPARWMNDTDLNQALKIRKVVEEEEQVEVTFETPLLQECRRQIKFTSPEYGFLYAKLGDTWEGSTVFYGRNKNGFRAPAEAHPAK